jgi:acrylyl-CoA reductase (NADPH)
MAVALLANLGYKVAASTGRPELHDYLRSLGANEIISRATMAAASKHPLDSERWAAAIDSVGGDTLAAVLRSTVQHGSVAACGLAGGTALNTTVFPFILRGVNLIGIASPKASKALRLEIWSRLASDLPMKLVDSMSDVAPLAQVFELGEKILAGQIRGRMVIDVNA